MNTPATGPAAFNKQVVNALLVAGAVIVIRCPICGEWHDGECPFANGGVATPFIGLIPNNDAGIVDGVGYDGRAKPDMVRDDDMGWRGM